MTTDSPDRHASELPTDDRRVPRPGLLVGAVVVISGAYQLLQARRAVALFDLSYVLDTATRFAGGQVPYRDFPLVHPPGTFFVYGVIFRFLSSSYTAVLGWMVLTASLNVVLVFFVLRSIARRMGARDATLLALVGLVPMTVANTYHVLFQPFYDADAVTAVLVVLALLLCSPSSAECSRSWVPRRWTRFDWRLFAVGVTATLPFMFKQNTGAAFLAVLVVSGACGVVFGRVPLMAGLRVLSGITIAVGTFLVAIATTSGLQPWFHWTVEEANDRRLRPLTSSVTDLEATGADRELVAVLVLVVAAFVLLRYRPGGLSRWIATLAIIAPLGGATVVLLTRWTGLTDRLGFYGAVVEAFRSFTPVAVFVILVVAAFLALASTAHGVNELAVLATVAACFATLLAQGYLGSTHSLWPLIVILAYYVVLRIAAWANPEFDTRSEGDGASSRLLARPVATVAVLSLSFVAVLAPLSYSRFRYGFVDIHARGTSSSHWIDWVRTPGPYLASLDDAVDLYRKYHRRGRLAFYPGEDPVYFVLQEVPDADVSASDLTTNPYRDLDVWLRRNRIEYVILKTELQGLRWSDQAAIFDRIEPALDDFERIETRGPYEVYERRG